MRDVELMKHRTLELVQRSRQLGLMHAQMESRSGVFTTIKNQPVATFTNCSYLGFDTKPEVVRGACELLTDWGTHYCCARTRLSIKPLFELEERLSKLFGSPAITFPSVTSTHAAVLPLLANGILLQVPDQSARPKFIFDRYAHASMQVLKPIIRETADVVTITHNDMEALEREILISQAAGQICIFLCDSVYSMGGVSNLSKLLEFHDRYNIWLYVDDAHGTSIFGDRGQGYVGSMIEDEWPSRLLATFSLAKGFGCNGGGIILPNKEAEDLVRYYGQTYSFSGPLDFAIVGAALKVLDYHEDGRIKTLQAELRRKVALVDAALAPDLTLPFSPIRMINVGNEHLALDIGEELIESGFYVPVVFYPVVPWGKSQLRLCITVEHSDELLLALCEKLKSLGLSLDSLASEQSLLRSKQNSLSSQI